MNLQLFVFAFLSFYKLQAAHEPFLQRSVRIVKTSSSNYTAEDVESSGLYGGVTAFPNEFPFLVSLQYYSYQDEKLHHFCSGSLLNDRWVITLASCSNDHLKIFLVGGEFNLERTDSTEQTIPVSQFLIHPDFDRRSGYANLALAASDYPFQLSNQVSPIALVGFESIAKVGDLVALPGWGSISTLSPILLKLYLPVVPCSETIPNRTICILETNDQDYDTHERSFCSVDLGSPAVKLDPSTKKVTLVGLVSMAPRDCFNPTEPLILTDVTGFKAWISAQTAAVASPRFTVWKQRFRSSRAENIANVTCMSATVLVIWTLFGFWTIGNGVLY